MGLDMYLRGEKFFWQSWRIDGVDEDRKEDGLRVTNVEVDLGYWRKHPNLHGYIVQTFAGGEDECQKIELGADNLRDIIEAVRAKRLPETTGFFFGESDGSEAPEDIEILERALRWLESGDIAPVHMKEPQAIGGGFAIAEMVFDKAQDAIAELAGKPPDTGQRVTRSIFYRASW
jgi:hypothetical protein